MANNRAINHSPARKQINCAETGRRLSCAGGDGSLETAGEQETTRLEDAAKALADARTKATPPGTAMPPVGGGSIQAAVATLRATLGGGTRKGGGISKNNPTARIRNGTPRSWMRPIAPRKRLRTNNVRGWMRGAWLTRNISISSLSAIGCRRIQQGGAGAGADSAGSAEPPR